MDGPGRWRIGMLAGLGIALVAAMTWRSDVEPPTQVPNTDRSENVPPAAVPTLVPSTGPGGGGRAEDDATPRDDVRAALLRVDTRITQMRRIASAPRLRENLALAEAIDILERAAGCVALSAHHALARYRIHQDRVHVHAIDVEPVQVRGAEGRKWRWVGVTTGREVGARGRTELWESLLAESALVSARAEVDGTGAFLRWAKASLSRDDTPAATQFIAAGESAADDLDGLLALVHAHLQRVAQLTAEGRLAEPVSMAGSGR